MRENEYKKLHIEKKEKAQLSPFQFLASLCVYCQAESVTLISPSPCSDICLQLLWASLDLTFLAYFKVWFSKGKKPTTTATLLGNLLHFKDARFLWQNGVCLLPENQAKESSQIRAAKIPIHFSKSSSSVLFFYIHCAHIWYLHFVCLFLVWESSLLDF